MLGKGLLLKAIDNITPEYLNSLKEHNNANESEIQLISTLLNLLEVLNKSKNFNQLNSWDDVCEYLNESLISQLVNASENIQQRNYDREVLYQIREEFKVKPDSKNQNDVLVNIKEVMCEIFCLIDIIDEIATIKGKARYDRTKATRNLNVEMDDTYLGAKSGFTFGTPSKDASRVETFISPITGKSTSYVRSPDGGNSSAEKELMKSSSTKLLYSDYPCKSPNERLIDIKNSTWKTKHTLQNHGNMRGNKLLYTVGPREAYVVDKTFDRDMNFLQLGMLSHDGELVMQKKGDRQYIVDINTGYNDQHFKNKNKNIPVTDSMRKELFQEMNDEHEVIVTSPKKYNRSHHL